MSKPTFDCPRRSEQALWGRTNAEVADYIEFSLGPEAHPVHDDDGNVIAPQNHWRADRTCSYCGGMSPEKLFEALDAGAELGPTDKSYKAYVGGPAGGKLYTLHLNRENAARLRKLILDGKVNIGYPGYFYNGLWLAPPAPEEG